MSSGTQAEEQSQAAGSQFYVRCARELVEALESPDGEIRLAALYAVQDAPETALSFGPYAKRDLLDVLLSQAELLRGELEWLSWIGVLAAFHDPRVVRLFTSLMATESHTELLFALANYLRAEPVEPIRTELGPALMQNGCVARARAVASVLAGCPGLSPGETLRIGLLHPGHDTSLPVFSAALGEWLNELAGPFRTEAQLELQRQGASTLAALVGYWQRLSESAKKWLLQWASDTDPDLVLDGIREVLGTKSEGLILAALEAAAELKDFPADLETLIIPFLEHGDELVRRAAVMACRSALNWRPFFENEPSVLVKQAWIARVMDQEGRDAVPFALQQLADPDWRIRAAAAEGLVSLGEWGVRAGLMLLPEAGEPVRIAVARMVADLADEQLLDEFVYRCSQPIGTQSANLS
jgi:HEAT repeat protein